MSTWTSRTPLHNSPVRAAGLLLSRVSDFREGYWDRDAGRFVLVQTRYLIASGALCVQSPTMEYRGIRYTLRLGIERQKWTIGIHPEGVAPLEKAFTGTRQKAEQCAQSMIDVYRRQQTATVVSADP